MHTKSASTRAVLCDHRIYAITLKFCIMNRRGLLRRGLASVSAVTIVSGCSGITSPSEATFTIEYAGSWTGTVGGTGSMRTVSGRGTESFTIEDPSIVSGNAQKRDGGAGTLTVSISAGGEVVAESSTSSRYGVAQVSHSF